MASGQNVSGMGEGFSSFMGSVNGAMKNYLTFHKYFILGEC
jgi:hypothetical protein